MVSLVHQRLKNTCMNTQFIMIANLFLCKEGEGIFGAYGGSLEAMPPRTDSSVP